MLLKEPFENRALEDRAAKALLKRLLVLLEDNTRVARCVVTQEPRKVLCKPQPAEPKVSSLFFAPLIWVETWSRVFGVSYVMTGFGATQFSGKKRRSAKGCASQPLSIEVRWVVLASVRLLQKCGRGVKWLCVVGWNLDFSEFGFLRSGIVASCLGVLTVEQRARKLPRFSHNSGTPTRSFLQGIKLKPWLKPTL